MTDFARDYFELTEHRRKIFEVPFPGKTARAFREGALTCPDGVYGEARWEEFLRRTLDPARSTTAAG